MCELFCLSSRLPTTASFSLERLSRHGALGQRAVDGWGLASYEGPDIRLYKEPEPAGESQWLDFIRDRPLQSSLVMSHIRRATRGRLTHANTQPFVRELGGRMHAFAHNGRLVGLDRIYRAAPHRFAPVGQTDSEIAFCILLDRLAPHWSAGSKPSAHKRLVIVKRFAAQMRECGIANFLYADGEFLFAHGHRRRQPNGQYAPPGLWRLERQCDVDPDLLGATGIQLGAGQIDQQVILIASVPLTDEPWAPVGAGQIVVVNAGRIMIDSEAG